MELERKYVDCRFSPHDVADAVREFWKLCGGDATEHHASYSITRDNDETVKVQELEQFLNLARSGFKVIYVRCWCVENAFSISVLSTYSTVGVTAPTSEEMQGIFTIFETRRGQAVSKRIEEIVPKYTLASRYGRVNSCSVSVSLLQDLEKQLLARIPACTGIPQKAVADGLQFTVRDEGTERFSSVTEYDRPRFRDSVREATLKADIYDSGRHCAVEIGFAERATVVVTTRCPDARDVAATLVRECTERISERSNDNYAWRLSTILFLLLAVGASMGAGLEAVSGRPGQSLMWFLVAGCAYVLNWLISKWKPLCAFDTERQSRRDEQFRAYFRLLVGFLICTAALNTVFIHLRRQYLGW